jgi:acetyltransferase-like isoleucine patch superfamily enzyme
MFERYTEKARRVIFFARYEASQYGAPYIETEHLLLGLLREDKALTNRFLRSHASVESIRKQIEGHTVIREKTATSVDLPLSNECKRILAHAAEEARQMGHKHIGTEHLLLGILREDKCFGAAILTERGVELNAARNELIRVGVEKESRSDPESATKLRSRRSLQTLIERLIDLDDEKIAAHLALLDAMQTAGKSESAEESAETSEEPAPDESSQRIDLYKIQSTTPLKTKLLRGLWHCFQLPFFKHTPRMLSPLRIFLLRLFGARIGPACHVGAGVKVWVPWNLTMGERSALGFDCEIYNFAPVEIGDHVVISQRSYVCTSTHNFTHPHFPLVSARITIRSQAWIAAGVFISPSVTIGEGAVIGAWSVVTRSMPPWMVCAGNPCRPLKPRVIKPAE